MESIIANIVGGIISGVFVLFIERIYFQPKKREQNLPLPDETKSKFNMFSFGTPHISSPTTVNKIPVLAAILSFLLMGGAGQIYLGQRVKGLTLIIITLLTSVIGIGLAITILCTVDAYRLAARINAGEYIQEWEFDLSPSTIFFSLLITVGIMWLFVTLSG